MTTPTVTFTVGPPGAGKTRWAHQQVAERGLHEIQRVSTDDFVTMLHGRSSGELTNDDLKLIRRMLIEVIRGIVESGRDVIVDSTHLTTRFPAQVREELGDEFEYAIKDFTGIDLATCVEQDAVRSRLDPGGHVGEEAVTRLHQKGRSLQKKHGGAGLPGLVDELNKPDGIEPYKPDLTLPKAVIFDIDGTLAIANSRGPYDTSRYHTDDPEHRLTGLLNNLRQAYEPHAIVGLTGRDEAHRAVTEEWLERHQVHWDELWMRPEGDMRRDNVVKLELFNVHLRHRFNVVAAFDDRDRVVRLWRRLGILCAQVAYGAF